MSEYLPPFVFGSVTNAPQTENAQFKIGKSRSSESVFKNNDTDKTLSFEKKIDNYKKNIAEEERMRDKIIHELLFENEKITSGRRRSFDFGTQQKVYNKNSKYKSRFSETNDAIFDRDHYLDAKSDIFIIPKLPKGSTMLIDILSTWGDKYYVGLNGIEVFADDGNIAEIKSVSKTKYNLGNESLLIRHGCRH